MSFTGTKRSWASVASGSQTDARVSRNPPGEGLDDQENNANSAANDFKHSKSYQYESSKAPPWKRKTDDAKGGRPSQKLWTHRDNDRSRTGDNPSPEQTPKHANHDHSLIKHNGTHPRTEKQSGSIDSGALYSQQNAAEHERQSRYYGRQSTSDDEPKYVLTLETNPELHARMTELRTKYFPSASNKLDAHLTLFHALPASKLESDVIPAVKSVVQRTPSLQIMADRPKHLRQGFAVEVSNDNGNAGRQILMVRNQLQRLWRPFLSEQDLRKLSNSRVHYTLMNKEQNKEKVQENWDNFLQTWNKQKGYATGLALWLYSRDGWTLYRRFEFAGSNKS